MRGQNLACTGVDRSVRTTAAVGAGARLRARGRRLPSRPAGHRARHHRARQLAEIYRQLLGYAYRAVDEVVSWAGLAGAARPCRWPGPPGVPAGPVPAAVDLAGRPRAPVISAVDLADPPGRAGGPARAGGAAAAPGSWPTVDDPGEPPLRLRRPRRATRSASSSARSAISALQPPVASAEGRSGPPTRRSDRPARGVVRSPPSRAHTATGIVEQGTFVPPTAVPPTWTTTHGEPPPSGSAASSIRWRSTGMPPNSSCQRHWSAFPPRFGVEAGPAGCIVVRTMRNLVVHATACSPGPPTYWSVGWRRARPPGLHRRARARRRPAARAPPRRRQGVVPPRARAVEPGPGLRPRARPGTPTTSVPLDRRGPQRPVRQPPHRGQPPVLLPHDRAACSGATAPGASGSGGGRPRRAATRSSSATT